MDLQINYDRKVYKNFNRLNLNNINSKEVDNKKVYLKI